MTYQLYEVKMKQVLRGVLLWCCCLWISNASAQHVFYGERSVDTSAAALFFDKDGFPYPDHFISDSSLAAAYGSLFTWFMQNGSDFIQICADYQLFPERIDRETIFMLRDSISARYIRTINERSRNFPAVAFYVHGFRKRYTSKGSDVTSAEEFRLLKANLAGYGKPQPLEIEVYWDGMYDCCFSANRKRNHTLFHLFETAAVNARAVGVGLRTIISGIETDRIQILSHSLGAQVVASALFNSSECAVPTPSQSAVSVCMLAPAISGRSTFQWYHQRMSACDYTAKDNYSLMIVYNREDFVLRKKDPKTGILGPGTKRYGETSLGCNYHGEAVKLKRYFEKKYPHSVVRLVDKTTLGKAHSLRYYASGTELKEVSDFLWEGSR